MYRAFVSILLILLVGEGRLNANRPVDEFVPTETQAKPPAASTLEATDSLTATADGVTATVATSVSPVDGVSTLLSAVSHDRKQTETDRQEENGAKATTEAAAATRQAAEEEIAASEKVATEAEQQEDAPTKITPLFTTKH